MTLSSKAIEQRRQAGRKGGAVRAKQFTSDYQKLARAHVSSASCRLNGKKGAEATLKKYGAEVLSKKLALYRQNHPSDLETLVAAALNELGYISGYDYVREEPAIYYKEEGDADCQDVVYFDFVLYIKPIILEVDDETWHSTDSFAGDRTAQDRLKERIAKERGYKLVRLGEKEIRTWAREGILTARLKGLLHDI